MKERRKGRAGLCWVVVPQWEPDANFSFCGTKTRRPQAEMCSAQLSSARLGPALEASQLCLHSRERAWLFHPPPPRYTFKRNPLRVCVALVVKQLIYWNWVEIMRVCVCVCEL